MKKFRRIEPVKEKKKKLKVAAYCRVSTKSESQQSNIDLQISNYETVIQSNPLGPALLFKSLTENFKITYIKSKRSDGTLKGTIQKIKNIG